MNKVNIRPEYMNNPQELAKIRRMIDELKSDPNVKVNRLDLSLIHICPYPGEKVKFADLNSSYWQNCFSRAVRVA